MSDIDTAPADSLKALDPNRPIREADIGEPRLARIYIQITLALGLTMDCNAR